jgi:hypothetical protein
MYSMIKYKQNYNMKKIFYSIIAFVAITIPFHILQAKIEAPDGTELPTINKENGSYLFPVIDSVIAVITTIIASLAVLMIIVGGIMYLTSGGDQQRVETAKKILIYSIGGLVVAILAYAIVMLVLITFSAL